MSTPTFTSAELINQEVTKIIYDNWESPQIQDCFQHNNPKYEPQGQKKLVFALLKQGRQTQNGFIFSTKYKYAKNQTEGRQFAVGGMSLGNLQRSIRGAIASV